MPSMQVCSVCGVRKPHTAEHFSGEGRKNGRLGIRCRPCKSKRVSKSFQAHPETRRAIDQKSRARRDAAGALDLSALTRAALSRQGGVCYYCRVTLSARGVHGEHKTPASRGGRTTARNVVAACSRCNQEKHNKTEAEYRAWRRRVGRE
jgi:5-methylcytosine-specific restriction endonuclease McrA